MAISIACPSCGRQYNVKDDAAGKRFKCKDCEAVVEVPAGGGDEFGADDYGEPYDPYGAAPAGEAMPAPARRRTSSSAGGRASSAAADRTKWPAIIMYVVCVLSIGLWFLDFGGRVMGLNGAVPGFVAPEQQGAFRVGNVGGMVIDVLFVFRELFLIYAFSRMQNLKSFNIAYAGAVISVIPCVGSPCCLLGIPFGIWSLVVLNDPAVKASFR